MWVRMLAGGTLASERRLSPPLRPCELCWPWCPDDDCLLSLPTHRRTVSVCECFSAYMCAKVCVRACL